MIQLLRADVLHESCMPLVHSQTHGEGHIVLIACVVPNILVQANHQMKSLLLIDLKGGCASTSFKQPLRTASIKA